MYEIMDEISIEDKLTILSDAAKYDVACTSSGSDRRGKEGFLGNSCPAGVCHTFAADGRCVSLLKILMTNHCIFDCSYCKNRKSNDVSRATFSPDEICQLTIEFYRRNYIEGLFLSSGVINSPEYTMEKICETLRLLRTVYRFNGYIHVKAIPGAPNELIYSAGLLADRISINMELPTQESLRRLAPNKSMQTILKPMDQISQTISAHRIAIGKDARMERAGINKHLVNSIFGAKSIQELENQRVVNGQVNNVQRISNGVNGSVQDNRRSEESLAGIHGTKSAPSILESNGNGILDELGLGEQNRLFLPAEASDSKLKRSFAPAGQSTQMIVGASGETDLDIIRTTESLYRSFDLKRVFYSGYIPLNEDPLLPAIGTPVPLLREHRLYQADWLLRYYGFVADELLTKDRPNFDSRIDPKCNWALRNLGLFPVEINKASYAELLRVPGIGPTSVKRIVSARRYSNITFEMLKKMGVVLKRAQYFITCGGRMFNATPIEEQFILNRLTDMESKQNSRIQESYNGYQQMNLFSDFGLRNGA